jgi:flagellar hook assembly protein FlgD
MRTKTARHPESGGRTNGEYLTGSGSKQSSDSSLVQIEIQDLEGLTVRRVTMGKNPAGDGQLVWSAKDSNHKALSAGIYSFSVNIVNPDGSSFSNVPGIKAG